MSISFCVPDGREGKKASSSSGNTLQHARCGARHLRGREANRGACCWRLTKFAFPRYHCAWPRPRKGSRVCLLFVEDSVSITATHWLPLDEHLLLCLVRQHISRSRTWLHRILMSNAWYSKTRELAARRGSSYEVLELSHWHVGLVPHISDIGRFTCCIWFSLAKAPHHLS
jgi:hypothetical protein